MTTNDIRAQRMRCFGHILNLVAKAFLSGTKAEMFESQSQALEILQYTRLIYSIGASEALLASSTTSSPHHIISTTCGTLQDYRETG